MKHSKITLYQANMPNAFWAEDVTTAVYLLNCLRSDSVYGIPYEMWIVNN